MNQYAFVIIGSIECTVSWFSGKEKLTNDGVKIIANNKNEKE